MSSEAQRTVETLSDLPLVAEDFAKVCLKKNFFFF